MEEEVKSDWKSEALAVIEDVKEFVLNINIADTPKSSDAVIYLDIVTLEKEKLLVSMSSCGFTIHGHGDNGGDKTGNNQQEHPLIYETINALLDNKSVKYRKAFTDSLSRKLYSIHNDGP